MNATPSEKSGVAGSATIFADILECFRSQRFTEARERINRALRREPNNAQLWNLAGSTDKALGQPDAAMRCWRTAITLDPGLAEAHYNLGVLLQESQNHKAAVSAYRTALQRPAWHPQALNNLGIALIKEDQPQEAVRCFEQAIALAPDYGKAHGNLGRALRALGRTAEATRTVETAIDLAPDSEKVRLFQSLATLKRFVQGDKHLLAMEELAGQMAGLSPAEQIALHFSLGKAYADTGQAERSFQHLLEGTRKKREQLPYDEKAVLGRLEQLRQAYSPATMSAKKAAGCPSSIPIFIVGMPRSGSTLVEQILASHPDVTGGGECEEFRVLADQTRLPDGSALQPSGIGRLPDAALGEIGRRYVQSLQRRAPSARHITDKNLTNFANVGLIHLALPNARIIHTRRDPVDTCLSCFSHLFEGDYDYTYDLAELGRYWRAYDRLMSHWHSVLPEGVLLEMHYEALVADQEAESRRLLEHCGLPWDAACLNFHETPRAIFTASAPQVREPIYRSAMGKSRTYGALLEPLLGALAEEGSPANPRTAAS